MSHHICKSEFRAREINSRIVLKTRISSCRPTQKPYLVPKTRVRSGQQQHQLKKPGLQYPRIDCRLIQKIQSPLIFSSQFPMVFSHMSSRVKNLNRLFSTTEFFSLTTTEFFSLMNAITAKFFSQFSVNFNPHPSLKPFKASTANHHVSTEYEIFLNSPPAFFSADGTTPRTTPRWSKLY